MSDCKICDIISSGKANKIYEDEKIIGILCPEPVAAGHIWIIPKDHYPIIENIPDYEVSKMFSIANKISISLFESLKVQGTNIFVANGPAAGQIVSHFIINIIPRMPNDSINMTWQPRQLTEEEMSTVELSIKEQVKSVGYFEKEKAKPIELDKKREVISNAEDYLVKSLRRIP